MNCSLRQNSSHRIEPFALAQRLSAGVQQFDTLACASCDLCRDVLRTARLVPPRREMYGVVIDQTGNYGFSLQINLSWFRGPASFVNFLIGADRDNAVAMEWQRPVQLEKRSSTVMIFPFDRNCIRRGPAAHREEVLTDATTSNAASTIIFFANRCIVSQGWAWRARARRHLNNLICDYFHTSPRAQHTTEARFE